MRYALCGLILACVAPAWADIDTLVTSLASEDPDVRVEAAEGAAALGYDAIAPVAQLLDHEDFYVVQAAKHALENICGREPIDAAGREIRSTDLVRGLRQVTGNEGRRWVAWLLSYCGDWHSAPGLLVMLDDPALFDHALFALQGIGNVPADPLRPVEPTCAYGRVRDGVAEALLARAQQAGGARRVALLNVAGAIGDWGLEVVPMLIVEARKPAPECEPAIEALGRIGDARAADVVWEQYQKGSAVALDAYLKIAEQAKPKPAQKMYEKVIATSPAPHVQCAALRAIGRHGGRGNVDVLVPYLAADRADIRGSAAKALEELDGRWVTRRVRKHLQRVDPASRSALLHVIAAREGTGARDVLEKALTDSSPEVRVTALALLGREPDPRHEQTFLDAAQSGSADARPAALRAYLGLADSVLRSGDEAKAQQMYMRALDLATDNRARALAAEGLAQVGDMASLDALMEFTTTPGLEMTAGLAVLAIAEEIAASEPAAARGIYLDLLDRQPPRELAARIDQQLEAIGVTLDPQEHSGVVTNWHVIGPFPALSFETIYPPEFEFNPTASYDGAADQKVAWQPYHVDDIQGIVDLPELMKPTDDVIAYARAEVRVDQAKDILIKLGSDDGVMVWLNGEKIHSNNASRRVQLDDDIVPARLLAGTNVLLLKIVNGGSGWGYAARLTDREGKPLRFEN